MQGKNEAPATSRFSALSPMSPTKEKILLAAIDMFSKLGYSAVSVRDITREVGIKESSLYNHFRNKDEILETIFTLFKVWYRKLLPPLDRLDSILSETTPEAFLSYGNQLYMNLVSDEVIGKVWRIMHMEQYRDPRAMDIIRSTIVQGTLSFLEEVFRRMIDFGYIKPLDPALLASEYQYPVFAMATEYNMLKFQGLDTTGIETKLANHVRFFIEAVRHR
jgi:AcrR family transcriptional regulator